MSRKPETTFINAVHKKVKASGPRPHFEKMHNPYRGGTADVWYSGEKSDLWVEYKWITDLPASGYVVPDLSTLQRDWLDSRWAEGRRVWVAVGHPDGVLVATTPTDWGNGMHTHWSISREDYARSLQEFVGPCKSSKESSIPLSHSTASTAPSQQRSSSRSRSTRSTTVSGPSIGEKIIDLLGNQKPFIVEVQHHRRRK